VAAEMRRRRKAWMEPIQEMLEGVEVDRMCVE
jgi:hypothetical protein